MIRFIGDVHQAFDLLIPLVREADHVIQVGDLGFTYSYLRRVGVPNLKFIAGNHDHYGEGEENYRNQPFSLGDYGLYEVPGHPPIFYVRGAWSIDHMRRKQIQNYPYNTGPVSYWDEEQLSYDDFEAAIALYKETKPQVVVSHECPLDLVKFVTNPEFCLRFGYPAGTIKTRTNIALQAMLDAHQPRRWFFGHYHRAWQRQIDGTTFRCLDMLRSPQEPDYHPRQSYFDLESDDGRTDPASVPVRADSTDQPGGP